MKDSDPAMVLIFWAVVVCGTIAIGVTVGITRATVSGGGVVEHKPRPLDNSRIDYRSKMHTASTMIKEGVYPDGVSQSEVEAVVQGSFGGRFEYFGDGKFKYIAYTD